ncbi:MAG: phosphoribosyltransferase family protein [Actinomycetota bacterium]
MLLTRNCPGCRRPDRGICRSCRHRLNACRVDDAVLAIVARRVGVERLVALWAYEPPSRRVVLALKNRARTDLADVLARALARHVVARPDVVAWVPASGGGRRRRGYDQGAVLARALARHLGVPGRRLLVRADRHGGRRRTRQRRLEGPALVAGPGRRRGPAAPDPEARVLLVDDVVTTGGSLAAAVQALRAAGYRATDAAVLAVVPDATPTSPSPRATVPVAAP